MSHVYQTPAINSTGNVNDDQPPFLNAALLAETDLHITVLKRDVLRAIEEEMGRVRTADKYAARNIDLDIALYGDEVLGLVIDYEDGVTDLVVPDPDITQHAHLALPLADVAPDITHPLTGDTLSSIAATFDNDSMITVRDDIDLADLIE